MGEALRTIVILSVLFLTGAPLAISLSSDRPELVRFVFEAITVGLVAQLLIALVALRANHFDTTVIGLLTLLVIAIGAVLAAWRRRIVRPRIEPLYLLGIGAVVLVALALRRHPIYFIFETGDMGEYINTANRVANGTHLVESFPNGFTVFLASTKLLLGQAHTVSGLPALGIAFLLGIVSLVRAVGVRAAAATAVGVVVAVHPMSVWFSVFPVSEALYATLFVAALVFFVRARIDGSTPYAIGAGVIIGVMFVVRGNALLLAPIIVVVFFVSAVVDRPSSFHVQRTFTASALIALGLAYAYDVRYTGRYFAKELTDLLPHLAYRAAHRLNLLTFGAALLVAFVAAFVVIMLAGWLLHRYPARPLERFAASIVRDATIGSVVVFALVLLAMRHGGLVNALARWGIVIVLAALAGVVIVARRPARATDGTTALWLVLLAGAFTVLFAHRLPTARGAPYYLYWDRYLFSEVFPLALFFLAITFDAVAAAIATHANRERVAAGVAIAAVVASVVLLARESIRVTRHTLFGDSYGALHRLDRLTEGEGQGDVVYSGTPSTAADWFFPTTARMFALPLQETFHRRVLGQSYRANLPEPVHDVNDARTLLASQKQKDGYLVSWRKPGDAIAPDASNLHYVGTLDYRLALLRRQVHPADEKFQFVRVQLDVYFLQTAAQ